MPDGIAPPRLGREFVGLTRVFRAECKRVDLEFDDAIAAIRRPLDRRLKRHPRLRHEMIAQATRLYENTMPAKFRIGAVTITPDRDEFEIRETRLTASWLRNVHWADDDNELGIAVARFTLKLDAGRLRERWEPVAVVSAHSLARWFERSGHRDHALLIRDLALLASADDVGGDEVATPEGCWLGSVIGMKGDRGASRARNVRTWR
jgi:hypothetical protein